MTWLEPLTALKVTDTKPNSHLQLIESLHHCSILPIPPSPKHFIGKLRQTTRPAVILLASPPQILIRFVLRTFRNQKTGISHSIQAFLVYRTQCLGESSIISKPGSPLACRWLNPSGPPNTPTSKSPSSSTRRETHVRRVKLVLYNSCHRRPPGRQRA